MRSSVCPALEELPGSPSFPAQIEGGRLRHLGDITSISGYDVPPIDVIIGGSPCQDLSIAGKRAGFAGARSGLFMEQIRLIKEVRRHTERTDRRVYSAPIHVVGKQAVKGTCEGSKLDVGMKISPVKERFNRLAECGEIGIAAIAGEESIIGLFLSGS